MGIMDGPWKRNVRRERDDIGVTGGGSRLRVRACIYRIRARAKTGDALVG